MGELILVLVGVFALWYLGRRIKQQFKGEGGCGNSSCESNHLKSQPDSKHEDQKREK
ncbi:MAG: hypothetical protein MI740_00360 [Halanaerobiales bacterium]|nr:hypothetical protein [Halanaerobiales bacterium]